MSQSRGGSALEAVVNVVAGFALAFTTQVLLFPAIGLQASLGQNLTLGTVFTGLSLVRGYLLRRLFERLSRGGGGSILPAPEQETGAPALHSHPRNCRPGISVADAAKAPLLRVLPMRSRSGAVHEVRRR